MIGTVVANYEITQQIGHGGMGTVYLAQHQMLGRLAAVKVLLPELSTNEEMVSRILNEARLAALIHHPGIVDVYEFGRLESGSAFLIMEYLEGETLADRIDRDGPLPIDLAVTLSRQIAQAVGAAHDKDIIHRDLKPENVFLINDDEIACGLRARILDFGIAKLSTGLAGNAHRTRTGNLMGTPIYMSPEQCRGAGTVDWRSDIYSLGCMMFEMVTGRVPFDMEGTGEIIAAHLFTEPPKPSSILAAVPPWLDDLILSTLAKKPEARPQTMEDLTKLLGGRPRTLQQQPPPATATTDAPRPRQSTTFRSSVGEVASPRSKRRIAKRALVAAGLVAVLGAAGFVVMTRAGSAKPAAPVPAAVPDEPRPTLVVPMPTVPAIMPAPPPPPPAAPDAGPVEIIVEPPTPPPVAVEEPPSKHRSHTRDRDRKKPTKPVPTVTPQKPPEKKETLDPFGE